MLDVGEGIGAYVSTTAGEAVVVDAAVGGQDSVKGFGEATTAGFKICEEDDFVIAMDIEAKDAVTAVVLGGAGIIVAPHVQIDTHVQTEEHVHENVDAWVQDTAVASESDEIAPGGEERIRGEVDDCEEDTVESCNEVGPGLIDEDDIDNDDESITSDDSEGNVGGADGDAGSGGGTAAVACVALCADGGTGGCPLGDDPEVAFLTMSAAYAIVSGCVAKFAFAV